MQWDERHDPFEAAIRKETTCCAAGKSQNETFDEQLANELAASGTNRGAHGNFFFAGSGASEKQVGHVAASDQEQHGDRADQGVQHALEIADDVAGKSRSEERRVGKECRAQWWE